MRYPSFLFILFLAFAVPSLVSAQGNPFLSGSSGEQEQNQAAGSPSILDNRLVGPLLRKSIDLQRTLQREISETMQEVKEKGNPGSLFVLLGVSFIFGFLHVMGPGHRKMLVIGYFMGEESKPLMGLAAGFLLSLAHAGSAIVLVGGFYWFASRSVLVSVNQAELVLLPVTYGIVALLGGWMIYRGLRDYRLKEKRSVNSKGLWGLVLSGLVPCPGASAIMILAVTSDAFLLGVLAVLAMSAGMGLLLAGLGFLSIFFRRSLSRFFEDRRRERILDLGFHLASGILMLLIGVFLMAGSLLG